MLMHYSDLLLMHFSDLHYKSPYNVPQPAAWMFLFLHMNSICEAFAVYV